MENEKWKAFETVLRNLDQLSLTQLTELREFVNARIDEFHAKIAEEGKAKATQTNDNQPIMSESVAVTPTEGKSIPRKRVAGAGGGHSMAFFEELKNKKYESPYVQPAKSLYSDMDFSKPVYVHKSSHLSAIHSNEKSD